MRSDSTLWLFSVALALVLTTDPALGQLGARRALVINPPRSAVLGSSVTLSAPGARYRFVATMTEAGDGTKVAGLGCPSNATIGSGTRVMWQPASGTYRLTAYGPAGKETDTLNVTYAVQARKAMLASSQTPAQPSGVTLVLRTDDLGPGHKYRWLMSYTTTHPNGTAGAGVRGWTAETGGPMVAYPTPVPQQASISARVGIHRGNPCEVVAAGAMGPTS